MQRKALALDSIIFLVAVAANVVLLNFIGMKVSARADLTRDELFTLSPGSVSILAGLEDTLSIKVYMTRDLPAPFNQLPRFLGDKLEEYKAAGKGKLTYQIVYPEDDEKLRKEAQELGVVQGNLQAIKADKLDVRKAYMGLVMFYGAQKDVLPWIPEQHRRMEPIYEYMEYNLSTRIKKLARGTAGKRKIGFLAGHDEAPLDKAMGKVTAALKEVDYDVVSVDTSGDKTIPADIDVLVVAGPKKKLTEREKWEVDQHLMRGKGVAFFVDSVNIQPQKGMVLGSPVEDGMKDLVAHYGVKVNQAIVLDEQNIPVPVPSHQRIGNMVLQGNVFKPYPPILAVQGIAEHPLSRGVAAKRFVMPFTAPLELDRAALAEREAVELAWSSANSWKMDGNFYLLNPTQDFTAPWKKDLQEALQRAETTNDDSGIAPAQAKAEKEFLDKGPPKNEKGRPGYSLAYAVRGKFKSFYAGKSLPEGVKAGAATVAENAEPTQIVVVGNAFWLQDNFFSPGNQLFLQNTIDWLLQDSDLMMIRARTFASPPLEAIEGTNKELVRYANVLGVPLLLIGFGLGLYAWRRRRKATASLT